MARAELAEIDSRIKALLVERARVLSVVTALDASRLNVPIDEAQRFMVEEGQGPLRLEHFAPAAKATLPPAPVPQPPAAPPATAPGLAAAAAALARPKLTQPEAVFAVLEQATQPLKKDQILALVRQSHPHLTLGLPVLNTVLQRLRKEGKIQKASYGHWILPSLAPTSPAAAPDPDAETSPANRPPADPF